MALLIGSIVEDVRIAFRTLLKEPGLYVLTFGSVGSYGAISYNVSQRAAEIGVRLALGAGSSQVRWMILMALVPSICRPSWAGR